MEACWYFTGSREQFRLTGTALVVDKDTEDGELQKVSLLTFANAVPPLDTDIGLFRVYLQCWPRDRLMYSLGNQCS